MFNLFKKPLTLKKTHDYCKVKPTRLTVVFIHGIASDSSAFYNALRYLEGTKSLDSVRFVTFDLLGAGKSYKGSNINYTYSDQLDALERSLQKLKIDTPLILVGHSMGTLIATRYASTHKKAISKLILCSPPIYTEEDLDNPAFEVAMKGFRDAVSLKNRKVIGDVPFEKCMKNIVMNRKNYKVLCELTTPAVLIYGDADPFIASFNIPKLMKANPKYLSKVKTLGRHGMSREKYSKVREILEEELNAKTI